MNGSDKKKMCRYIAGVTAAVLLTVMLLSAAFISAHIHHDCTGDHCPVCAMMHQCEKALHSFGGATSGNAASFIPLCLILFIISLPACSFTISSPVSDKVRLND